MITPVSGSTASMISATASMRGLLSANIATAAAEQGQDEGEIGGHQPAPGARATPGGIGPKDDLKRLQLRRSAAAAKVTIIAKYAFNGVIAFVGGSPTR